MKLNINNKNLVFFTLLGIANGYAVAATISQNITATLNVPATCSMQGLPSLADVKMNLKTEVRLPLGFSVKCNMDKPITLTLSSQQFDPANGFYLNNTNNKMLYYKIFINNVQQTSEVQTSITPNQTYPVLLTFPPVNMQNEAGRYTGTVIFNILY